MQFTWNLQEHKQHPYSNKLETVALLHSRSHHLHGKNRDSEFGKTGTLTSVQILVQIQLLISVSYSTSLSLRFLALKVWIIIATWNHCCQNSFSAHKVPFEEQVLNKVELVFLHTHFLSSVEIISNGICCCCIATQLCPTLCDPTDGSPPGSSVHGILQARILEWVAISFFKWTSSAVILSCALLKCQCKGKSAKQTNPQF